MKSIEKDAPKYEEDLKNKDDPNAKSIAKVKREMIQKIKKSLKNERVGLINTL